MAPAFDGFQLSTKSPIAVYFGVLASLVSILLVITCACCKAGGRANNLKTANLDSGTDEGSGMKNGSGLGNGGSSEASLDSTYEQVTVETGRTGSKESLAPEYYEIVAAQPLQRQPAKGIVDRRASNYRTMYGVDGSFESTRRPESPEALAMPTKIEQQLLSIPPDVIVQQQFKSPSVKQVLQPNPAKLNFDNQPAFPSPLKMDQQKFPNPAGMDVHVGLNESNGKLTLSGKQGTQGTQSKSKTVSIDKEVTKKHKKRTKATHRSKLVKAAKTVETAKTVKTAKPVKSAKPIKSVKPKVRVMEVPRSHLV